MCRRPPKSLTAENAEGARGQRGENLSTTEDTEVRLSLTAFRDCGFNFKIKNQSQIPHPPAKNAGRVGHPQMHAVSFTGECTVCAAVTIAALDSAMESGTE